MKVNKNITMDTLEELIKVVQKLEKEKRTFNFSGNVDNVNRPTSSSYNVNCIEETDEF